MKELKELQKIPYYKSFKIKEYEFIYNENLFNIEAFNDRYLTLFNALDKPLDYLNGILSQRELEIDLLIELIGAGHMIIFYKKRVYSLELLKPINRTPSESKVEPEALAGAKDGFIESAKLNLALIEARLRTNDLSIETVYLGRKTKSEVDILYINTIAKRYNVELIESRLLNADIDGITFAEDISGIFEDNYLIPKTRYIGSPDLAIKALLEGSIVLIIDKIPVAISMPMTYQLFSNIRIDYIPMRGFAIMERIISLIAIFLSIFFLGIFYSFLTYNSGSVSLFILSVLKKTEQGTILPLFFEILFILLLFELYHLLSYKANKVVLSSMIVMVGGLIIGQNAVDSKLASVFVMALIAMCFLAQFAISADYKIVFSITVLRTLLLFCSALYGLYGFTLGAILFGAYIYYYDSLGTPFLYPLIPFDISGMKTTFHPETEQSNKRRSSIITENKVRKK